MKKTIPAFAIALSWLILTTILLTLPGSALPKANWLNGIWIDKWIHIVLFALLVILWARALGKKYPGNKKMRKYFILLGIAGLCYGIGMEYVQRYFIPSRSFETGDIMADAAGAATGVIYSWVRYIKK